MNGKRNNPSPYLWLPSTYFVEGLPFMGATILSVVIYQQMGLAVSNITFLVAWLYLPWVLQPLWQPFMRQLLSQRAWVVASELVALLTFCGLAYAIPSLIWLQGSLLCFGIMALASAATPRRSMSCMPTPWRAGSGRWPSPCARCATRCPSSSVRASWSWWPAICR